MRCIGLLVVPFAIGMVWSTLSFAQETKHFRVEHDKNYQSITLNYSASSGICYLAIGESEDAVSIYSSRDIDEFNHTFNKNQKGKDLQVKLSLDEKNNESFSQSISNKVFATSKPEDNIWKVILVEDIPYNLNLTYGIGTAFIDLAGLSVSNLKVKTGSADVNIGYLTSMPNYVEMDTMAIKVDLGNVTVRQIDQANVNNIVAEVGFGNMLLDMADPIDKACHVKASVGAGNLEIIIPKSDIPIIVKVKKSLLCDVKLTRSFTEKEDNIFVNTAYTEGADEILEFEVDVSFGSIIFKEKR
ncbi:MAG: hypothetical protein ABFS32_11285 [Bacteroidota bacterium]